MVRRTFSPMAQSTSSSSRSWWTTRIPERPEEDISEHLPGCSAEAGRRKAASISGGIMRSNPGDSETVGGGIGCSGGVRHRSQRGFAVIPPEGSIGSKGLAVEGQDFGVRVVHRQGGATSHKGRRSCPAGDFLEDTDGNRVGGLSSQTSPPPRGN